MILIIHIFGEVRWGSVLIEWFNQDLVQVKIFLNLVYINNNALIKIELIGEETPSGDDWCYGEDLVAPAFLIVNKGTLQDRLWLEKWDWFD